MKMQALLSAIWGVGLLLALSGARMAYARHNWHAPQTMFVFGDSFVDNGNLPRTDSVEELSRQWHYPYGVSYDDGSGAQPYATGRFSDFKVQSDLIANMLGLPQSPPSYQSTESHHCDPSGMNFAYGDTGVYRFGFQTTTIREQVNIFKGMIHRGTISQNQVAHSIALVAVSGHDYKSFRNNKGFIGNVTTEIATNVERLRNLGVKRVLVNNLHPLGCTPSQSRETDYDKCDDVGNKEALLHNRNLKQKLGNKKGVLIVDLNTAFGHAEKGFKQRRKPCCESTYPMGYCGQHGDYSEPLYTLCADPSKYFFWDDAHPTQAGWEAVMRQLQDPIKKFIGLA